MRFSPVNVGSFLASAVAAQAAAAITGLLLVRWMSVEDYALYTIGVTMLGTITLLTRGGVRQGLTALLARVWPDRTGAVEAADAALRVRLVISALTMPPIFGLAWLLLDRAGATAGLSLAFLALLALIWLADTYGAVIDQVLYFDRQAVRVQSLDSVLAWARLALVGLLKLAGAVSALAALATNLVQSAVRVPVVRHWIGQLVEGRRVRAPQAAVDEIRAVAVRQLPIDTFVALQAQATIFYLTLHGGGVELATYGALSRIAQLLTPFNAVILAYFVPHFAKVTDDVARRMLGYVAIGSVPALGLLTVALAAPQLLLFFVGPAYSAQTWPLLVCAGMVAFTNAVEVSLALVAHRGWNRWGWVRIVIGLFWIGVAPRFVPVHTAAGGYMLVAGFSVGTLLAVMLELRGAWRRGEVHLGRVTREEG